MEGGKEDKIKVFYNVSKIFQNLKKCYKLIDSIKTSLSKLTNTE